LPSQTRLPRDTCGKTSSSSTILVNQDIIGRYRISLPPYLQTCYAGSDERYRVPARIINEFAWHNVLARHMFILPSHTRCQEWAEP
jgi:ATP-dependent phosphoenolpyruvate carboxykinase